MPWARHCSDRIREKLLAGTVRLGLSGKFSIQYETVILYIGLT